MKIMKWLKKEFMKTPGYMRVNLSLLMILATSSVLSTSLLICNRAGNKSEESISGRKESLEVAVDGLQVKVTGKSTTEVVENLSKILIIVDTVLLKEPSSPYTPLEGRQTLKRPGNSFSTMYLQSP